MNRDGSLGSFIDSRNKQGLDIASKFISDLANLGIKAIVAGGFARDYYLGKHFKDIDIYVESTKGNPAVYNILTDKGVDGSVFYPKGARFYKGLNNLLEVYESYRHKHNIVIQIMEVDTNDIQKYVFEQFDLSICQILFDGNKIIPSDNFLKTIETKQITLNDKLTDEQLKYAFKRHIFKVLDKYNEYTLKIDHLSNSDIDQLAPFRKRYYNIFPNTKIFQMTKKGSIFLKDSILVKKEAEIIAFPF